MEEIKQSPLPSKAKIAAWWMIISGTISSLLIVLKSSSTDPFGFILFLVDGILAGFLFIIPAFLIFQKRKIGWWSAIIIISLILIRFFPILPRGIIPLLLSLPLIRFFIEYGVIHPFLVLLFGLPPFVFLLLDRKNFWKIAS